MKKLVYSPDYSDRIKELKNYLNTQFGAETQKKTIKEITERLHLLPDNECLGVSVREMFGVDTDYRYVFVAHQYVFYRVDEECVYVVNMYHEREDFMQKLFGIGNSSQALDEADCLAETDARWMSHEEVFGEIRRKLNAK